MATVKVQTWGDDLRLPCFISAAETAGLLVELEPLRRQSAPFQSKHIPSLKRNTWFALKRPADRTRTGLLCVWPDNQCCVYISGDQPTAKRPTPRVALLRLRVDPQFFAPGTGMTVFAASLSAAARRLWVEDTLVWKGRHVSNDETFATRFRMASQWLEHYCILDPRLVSGLDVEMAPWEPLDHVVPTGVWELQADEAGRRRLLWIANHAEAPFDATISHTPAAPAAVPKLDGGPLIAIATREAGPDQWALTSADGVSLGKALIRTLAVSSALRSMKAQVTRLEVAWNSTFQKWEAREMSTGLASHSANFDASK
jgi:hypothetical protein